MKLVLLIWAMLILGVGRFRTMVLSLFVDDAVLSLGIVTLRVRMVTGRNEESSS